MDINTWRTVLLGFVALGQTAFVVLYFTFPWQKSFLGRALFFKAVSLAILTDAFIVTRTFPLGNTDLMFILLYALLALGVWAQFFAFLKVRAEGHQNEPSRGGSA